MIFWVILGIICLIFLKRLTSKLEYKTWGGYCKWKDLKFPLWTWIIAAILLITPILGILMYWIVWIAVIICLKTEDDLRFKEGKTSLVMKIANLLCKEY